MATSCAGPRSRTPGVSAWLRRCVAGFAFIPPRLNILPRELRAAIYLHQFNRLCRSFEQFDQLRRLRLSRRLL